MSSGCFSAAHSVILEWEPCPARGLFVIIFPQYRGISPGVPVPEGFNAPQFSTLNLPKKCSPNAPFPWGSPALPHPAAVTETPLGLGVPGSSRRCPRSCSRLCWLALALCWALISPCPLRGTFPCLSCHISVTSCSPRLAMFSLQPAAPAPQSDCGLFPVSGTTSL